MILAVYSKLFNTTEEFLLLAWHYWISVPSTFSKIVWICRRIGATYCHRSSRQCCTASHVSFKSVSAADWNLARAAKQKESLTVWRGRSFLYLTSLQTWESICLACLVNGSSYRNPSGSSSFPPKKWFGCELIWLHWCICDRITKIKILLEFQDTNIVTFRDLVIYLF